MSLHTTLYRKYRPQTFEDVIGQERVITLIKAALEKQSIGHAYLFYGGRGTGKTSLARIFAKELGVQPEDMYEIDAASHTGVDHIRELNESTSALPFNSPYKVYIIDEVHMLSKNAFNALLKTLEEPPAHVIFMLATTELDKVIDTVVSRCQVLTLAQPTVDTLRLLIERITKEEGVTLSSTAMTTIALLGQSSFRDTLGTLQKVLTVASDTEIHDQEVETITGAPQSKTMQHLLEAVGAGDAGTALQAIADLSEGGISAELLVQQLLFYSRAVLLLRFQPDSQTSLEAQLGSDLVQHLKTLTGATGRYLNAAWVRQLISVLHDTKRAHLPFLPVELGIIEHLQSVVHKDTR
jgi:DNA polymerase-3 subunit gamma/tau